MRIVKSREALYNSEKDVLHLCKWQDSALRNPEHLRYNIAHRLEKVESDEYIECRACIPRLWRTDDF